MGYAGGAPLPTGAPPAVSDGDDIGNGGDEMIKCNWDLLEGLLFLILPFPTPGGCLWCVVVRIVAVKIDFAVE